MNKTKIDWADMTWNPVTGCKHGCEYCYARKIATRFGGHRVLSERIKMIALPKPVVNDPYPFDFFPTLHQYRLDEPTKIKKPQTIFVCSMGELFGDWVPDEWIQEVFRACQEAPQHRYLFLTKNPERYQKIYLPFLNNFYYGASVTNQAQFNKVKEIFGGLPWIGKYFLSIEPMLEPVNGLSSDMKLFSWVIIGAETGNRKGKVIPELEWVYNLDRKCFKSGIPVFMKESLRDIMMDCFMQEYPWQK